MIKGSIYRKDMAFVTVHAPANRAAKYVKETLKELKEKRHLSSYDGQLYYPSLGNR